VVGDRDRLFPVFLVDDRPDARHEDDADQGLRDADGGPITSGQAILRLFGYWVSGFVFYLGYIWIFIDKRRRGWMDLIAGTIVISSPDPRP
jgi:hypothetical protein